MPSIVVKQLYRHKIDNFAQKKIISTTQPWIESSPEQLWRLLPSIVVVVAAAAVVVVVVVVAAVVVVGVVVVVVVAAAVTVDSCCRCHCIDLTFLTIMAQYFLF